MWAVQHCHQFVRGIGDGELDFDTRFRIRQDDLCLIEY
jgi:hypothetical protein